MHLKLLEDYIAELAQWRIDNRHEFVETSDVISRLMDILIEEERRIPDFIIDGDRSANDGQLGLLERSGLFDDPDEEFTELYSDDDEEDDYFFSVDGEPVDRDRDDLLHFSHGTMMLEFDDDGNVHGIVQGYYHQDTETTVGRFGWTLMTLLVALTAFAVGLVIAP